MCSHMLEIIQSMPENRLVRLLEACVDYLPFEEVRPIPIQVMKRLATTSQGIPTEFLDRLSKSRDLLTPSIMPIDVLRDVWSYDGWNEVFKAFVFACLNDDIYSDS